MTETKKGFFKKSGDVDMTVGSISKHIIMFALPLFIGNIFQQLYNTVDTWVVGNYVSNEAFSAVGTVGPIINLLIGFFMGFSSGAGVVISQYYGAKRFDKVEKTVHTSMTAAFIFCILFTALGVALVPLMLSLMKTPDDVLAEATEYLTIYFAGVSGLLIYNIGSGILRAVGDSARPFFFLVVSAVINTVLDLVFVLCFNMGVEGVAYATVIAQGVSAVLVLIELMRTSSCIKLNIKKMGIDWEILGTVAKIGFPAALQLAITAFSNVFVQSYINYFGSDFMSGWTAYGKIDQLMLMPLTAVALAATTFVGQNLGVKDVERAKKGVRYSLLISVVSTVILMIPIMIFAPQFTEFFNSKPQVVEYGAMLLRLISPFYVLCCVNQVYASSLRGAGNSRAPMILLLFSFVVFRQIYLFIVTRFISNTVIPVALSYPAGWLVASILMTVYFKHVKLTDSRVV